MYQSSNIRLFQYLGEGVFGLSSVEPKHKILQLLFETSC